MKKTFGKYPTHQLGRCRCEQRFKLNDDEMRAIGDPSQVGSAAPINARACQVRMTSRAVTFTATLCP